MNKYAKFLNKVSSLRKPSPIRALNPLLSIPGMISLAGGIPNTNTFPFESLSIKLKNGNSLEVTREMLDKALQYSPTPGIPEFYNWVKEHQKRVHNPKGNWDVCVTQGSQDALCKSFEMLIDEGDAVLLENPTYPGALSALNPLSCEKISVPVDSEGIIPERLEEILQERKKLGKKMPKCLYTIPCCGNPSGLTIPNYRRKKIYDIACRYDFLILEDDPYFYLSGTSTTIGDYPQQSFLSIDTDGRVLRFDSLSKVLSSGMRIGWISGPKELVDQVNLHMQASALHASGVSQVLVLTLLSHWGWNGFQKHAFETRKFYAQRKELFVNLIQKYLNDYVEYNTPDGGMFLWMKLKKVNDSKKLIETEAREQKVLLVPGEYFHPEGQPGPFVRASFSTATEEQMNIALQRFANILQKYQ